MEHCIIMKNILSMNFRLINPHFVKKLVEKNGAESISAAFLIPDSHKEYFVEYLLRKYKGDFYRNRYPGISFVKT